MTDTEQHKGKGRNGDKYEALKWWAIGAAVAVFGGWATMVYQSFQNRDAQMQEVVREVFVLKGQLGQIKIDRERRNRETTHPLSPF